MTIISGVVQPDYDSCTDGPVGGVVEVPVEGPPGPEGPEGPQGPAGPPGTVCPLFCGTGSPEGVVTSPIGGIYEQTDAASTSHSVWFKHSGVGNTGWRQWAGLRGGDGANTALRIGDGSVASAARAIAFGEGAIADAVEALAFGDVADAGGVQAIAIGDLANAAGLKAIALGKGATAGKESSIAIGETTVLNDFEVNVGYQNVSKLNALNQWTVLIGRENDISGSDNRRGNIVIGYLNEVAQSTNLPAITIGDNNFVEGYEVVVIGSHAQAAGGLVAGTGVTEASYGVAIGTEVEAQADCFVAVGYQSKAYGIGASALGPHTQAGADADSEHTTAVGRFASSTGDRSVALGSSATAAHDESIALGHAAVAPAANEMRIGSATAPIDTITVVTSTGTKTITMV